MVCSRKIHWNSQEQGSVPYSMTSFVTIKFHQFCHFKLWKKSCRNISRILYHGTCGTVFLSPASSQDKEHPGSKLHRALQCVGNKHNSLSHNELQPVPLKQLSVLFCLAHLIPPEQIRVFVGYRQLSNFKQLGKGSRNTR